jgi:hypothetical protein
MKNKINGNKKEDKIRRIIADEKQITATLQRAVREAVETHKRAGNPIAVWEDGKAVLIKPEEI